MKDEVEAKLIESIISAKKKIENYKEGTPEYEEMAAQMDKLYEECEEIIKENPEEFKECYENFVERMASGDNTYYPQDNHTMLYMAATGREMFDAKMKVDIKLIKHEKLAKEMKENYKEGTPEYEEMAAQMDKLYEECEEIIKENPEEFKEYYENFVERIASGDNTYYPQDNHTMLYMAATGRRMFDEKMKADIEDERKNEIHLTKDDVKKLANDKEVAYEKHNAQKEVESLENAREDIEIEQE